ncbi:HEAT repeat-containing protein 6 [Iris pallida]|uniref:HEAT repeat-containing protein 6 n=1 Tax=Iris pallida TaxID=29817 RepID=A0AAX6EAE8_IRIPA|nr:HEAT repeat-containing protein 6 [Iris pallida]
MSSSASISADVRPWRTSFLTLRDETLASPPPSSVLPLLRNLLLSHSAAELAAAAANLPPHEVTSDVTLLAELALSVSERHDADETLVQICHLMHDVCCKVRMQINSSSWTIILNFLEKFVKNILGSPTMSFSLGGTPKMKIIGEILEILRLIDKAFGRNSSLSDNLHLIEFLCCVVSCLHSELLIIYRSNEICLTDTGIGDTNCNNLWEMQTIAFSMIGDALSRIASSISASLWHSVVEIIRKVMDFVPSKNLLIVDNIMSRFFATFFHCLHLVLTNPKGSLSGQVTGLVATLQMFLTYGLSSRCPPLPSNVESKAKGARSPNQKPTVESKRSVLGAYVPPHLRRRESIDRHLPDTQFSSDSEPSKYGLSSSDSDLSDNDGYTINGDHHRSSKTRLAVIVCIQDLCHAEPKSLTSLCTLLLPENDVLQPRKYQATLMTCLLFDPVLKIRTASALTLAAMLDGHSRTFLQVAEHKGSSKPGSFTTLSCSLGQILMQLHTGILYMIQQETHGGLLTSLYKVLVLLISATPYARMSRELLQTIIASLCTRIRQDLAFKIENVAQLGNALSCLGAAFSVSPPSPHVLEMLEDDISRGLIQRQHESSVLSLLLQLSEQGRHLIIRLEAFQVLRAVSHNYPSIVTAFWENISANVYPLLSASTTDDSCAGLLKSETCKSVDSTNERCTVAAIKTLDECLRAASGFRGADDLLECRLVDIQIVAYSTRRKKVSSAPSYELNGKRTSRDHSADCSSGTKQWFGVIEMHLPLALSHSSPLVRAASVTCFAGMTSSVFFSLSGEKQEFVKSSIITAALNDEAPSVRAAACRAIGVIMCFSQIVCSARLLNEFIHAVELNSHNSSTSVRITASWALANICDSLRHEATEHLESCTGTVNDFNSISVLVESALRLAKDGDKIKSNAVRALGNISRFIKFTSFSSTSSGSRDSMALSSQSCEISSSSTSIGTSSKSRLCLDTRWLERMVQAFVSCVTTGNVKVQWNVCHALSNLFMNDTLMLHDMSWAPSVFSILLLLLRDSTNYKIRIHAAVALAVPASRLDYGTSFDDVVQGLEHVLESLATAQLSTPSNFKYKESLEKQLSLTTLHVLSFASTNEDQALKDFLVKKSPFLEEWFKSLCSTSLDSNDQPSSSETGQTKNEDDELISIAPKKATVERAIKSLMNVYQYCNHPDIARRFERLVGPPCTKVTGELPTYSKARR